MQLRVKDLDFDHGTIIVREDKSSKDRALMLPELGTQPARAAVACTGMVAEGPGRGAAAALRFPTPLSGSIRAPGILAVVLGFAQHTRIRPIHGAVSCVAITCMTRPFSAPSNVP